MDKDEILQLRERLNKVIESENLNKEELIKLSRELDILVNKVIENWKAIRII